MTDRDLSLFSDGVHSLGSSTEPISMIENLVRLAADGAGANSASLYVVREGALHPWYVLGLSPEYVRACGPVPVGEQCCGRAVAHQKPWIVSNMLTDPDWVELREGISKTEIRAGFSVPVMQGDTCIGSLACHFKKPFTPNKEAISRNQVFATLIAFAFTKFKIDLKPRALYCVAS